MKCKHCGAEIPQERLEALPGVTTCVQHSDAKARLGFQICAHSKGTAPELVLINQNDGEAVRLAMRANRRSR